MASDTAPTRQISELQAAAPEIVEQASQQGAVEITRYGRTVAWVESPAEHERHRMLDEAAQRAIWAIDIERGLGALREGRTVPWDEAIARLLARYPGR